MAYQCFALDAHPKAIEYRNFLDSCMKPLKEEGALVFS
jgi:hypothetical protein